MDPVTTYDCIEIQAQDVLVDDVWVIPVLETGFHVRASHADKTKPLWILEGREGGRVVESVHNTRQLLKVLRPSADQGEFAGDSEDV